MLRVFLTHNQEDLEAYYSTTLPRLEAIADVVRNPLDRDLTTPELIEHTRDVDVIVAHRSTPGESSLFAATDRLLAFLRTAVDVSTIDIEAASTAGVLVATADKSFIASTAELALGLMIDVARSITTSTEDYHAGREPPQRRGAQLAGRTAGIIGFGAVGTHLAGLLVAMGMRVLAHDPHATVGVAGVVSVELDELLAASDFVLPLAASTPDTESLIDDAALDTMKNGAYLVNVSRGELLDEDAVAAALDSGILGGLAMDVGRAPDQRPSPGLAGRPGVVATPHLGGLTPENAYAQAASSAEQVEAIVAGEMPPRTLNPEAAHRFEDFRRRLAGNDKEQQ
jgi:D-3-phosphoglycerate dehydrogenase